MRRTRTISAEGCTSKSEIAISPAFRALDTHDLRRGLHFEIQKRNFTCIPRTRHARSPQKVALRNPKTQFHLHSAHSTRTISAEGSHFETMLQKYCACHKIVTRGHTKCCTGHAKASSSSSSKNATPLRNWALRPQNLGSMVRIPCACHVKHNPSNDTRLPTFWQRPRNTAPATIFTMCPIPCTCHVNSRFWPPHVTDSLHLPCKMTFMSENVREHPVKRCLWNCDFRDGHFVRACAVEINIESQNGIPTQTKPRAQRAYPDRTRPLLLP